MEVVRGPVEGRGIDGIRETDALDVVVVASRSEALLDDCLESIASGLKCGKALPARTLVIVVDNASPDDSARVAAAHHGVRVVVGPSNRGFGGGCDLGAAAGTAKYIFFVKPDARLEAWMRSFYAYLGRRHGALYAALCSEMAGLGLGLRAVAYAPSRPRLARRLARAAGEAIRLPIAASYRTGTDA
jgi:glycosyltransferase involved in cell wall biosynthesis